MNTLRWYFHPLTKLTRQRSLYLEQHQVPAVIRSLLQYSLPKYSAKVSELNYIILDFETTGLDPQQDDILSIGWVEMSGQYIELASATELYIKDACQIRKETAVINHIVPEMLHSGCSLDAALTQFLQAAEQKIIIAHGCVVEQRFLDRYFKQYFDLPTLPFIWLDTLSIEKYLTGYQTQTNSMDYRLAAIRSRYGLPAYNAHNALTDAIATAELFLALFYRLAAREKAHFADIFKISHNH